MHILTLNSHYTSLTRNTVCHRLYFCIGAVLDQYTAVNVIFRVLARLGLHSDETNVNGWYPASRTCPPKGHRWCALRNYPLSNVDIPMTTAITG